MKRAERTDTSVKTRTARILRAVYTGIVGFPDFLRPDVRKWFGSKYKILTDMGIDGFWNDMNEPAIFYSVKGLNKALDKAASLKGQNLDLSKFF